MVTCSLLCRADNQNLLKPKRIAKYLNENDYVSTQGTAAENDQHDVLGANSPVGA